MSSQMAVTGCSINCCGMLSVRTNAKEFVQAGVCLNNKVRTEHEKATYQGCKRNREQQNYGRDNRQHQLCPEAKPAKASAGCCSVG